MFKHVLSNPKYYNFGAMANKRQVDELNREALASLANRKTLEDLLEKSLDEDIIITEEMALFYLKVVNHKKGEI